MDGTAAAASRPATRHAARQIARSPHTHTANTSARTGSSPQTKWISKLYRSAAQIEPRELARKHRGVSLRFPARRTLQHLQQIRHQRRKLRAPHRTLRVYDHVPSCGYLQPVAAHHFAQTPPDPIAHHRPAQRLLDAEAEAALRQFIGAEENCEVGTRAALSGAVHGIKLCLPHKPRLARKFLPVPPRACRRQRAPRIIQG